MDQKFPVQVLLLILGIFFVVTAQNDPRCVNDNQAFKDYQVCNDHWICPQNVNCDQKSNCRCKAGFHKCIRKTNYKCIDLNECIEQDCGPRAVCRNTNGNYYCECLHNYRPIGSVQFCPVKGKAFCEEYKMKETCNMSSEQQEKLEECAKTNPQDPVCSVLQLSFNFLNSSCQASDKKIIENEAKKQLGTITNDINKVLEAKNDYSTFNNAQTSEFLNNIETVILLSFVQAPRTQSVSTSQLDVSMKAFNDKHCIDGHLSLMAREDNMEVPCELLDGKRDGAILISYKDLISNINGNFSNIIDPEEEDLIVVNSRLVSGAITKRTSEILSHPVIFRLVQIKHLTRFYKLYCMFWDLETNVWSDEGCKTEHFNQTHTTCSCNHLTSLAVIMAPLELMEDFALTIITYIGLSVSLVCLCLSLLTFILCRSLRSAHTSVLTALCGCLFLAQLLVLAGLSQTKNKLVCCIIAGGLHFLFLSSFSWMSIESALLFMTVRNLRAVNYMSSRCSNFPVMCLLAFGVPTVVVVITVAVGFQRYCSSKYCWLHQSLVWSFLGPACVFISTNTILLILTIFLLRKRLASLNTNVSTIKNTRLLTFKALAQALILGCTWSIGYFQFASFSQIMSYLFTICNSPQGAYIFIVHCLLNHQVRGEYRKFFSRQKKQAADDSTLQTASRSVNMTNITIPVTSSSSIENKAQWM